MQRRTNRPRTIASLLAGSSCLSLVATASADIAVNAYIDDDAYLYVAYDMPDFDQQRLGDLPANGTCHCVPASSANLLAYVATHGYPEVEPGVPFLFDWSTQFNYDAATAFIDELGVAMAVSDGSGLSPCGTSPDNAFDEISDRISEDFVVTLLSGSYWGNDFDLSDVAAYNATNDAIGMIAYYRFNGAFDGDGTFQITGTSGGHMVTLNTLINLGGDVEGLGVRDPWASLGTDAVQEEFATNFWQVTNQDTAWDPWGTSTMAVMGPVDSTTTQIRGIGFYVAISPKGLLTWSPYTAARLLWRPADVIEWNPEHILPAPIELDEHVWEVELMPDDIHLVVRSDRGLSRVNRLTGKIDPLPLPFSDPVTDIAVDRFGDTWAAAGKQLAIIDASGEATVLQMPGVVEALATIDPLGRAADEFSAPTVHALMAREGLIAKILRTPERHVVEFGSFPASIISDEARFVAAADRAYLLDQGEIRTFKGTDSFAEMPTEGGPGLPVIDMKVDGHHLILVDAKRKAHAYRIGERLEEAPDHPFHGAATDGRVALKVSRSSAKPWSSPTLDSTPEDLEKDQADSEIRFDCRADLNHDGRVDGADMGILFGAWGQGRSLADINRDGRVDSGDLGAILSAFGPCP